MALPQPGEVFLPPSRRQAPGYGREIHFRVRSPNAVIAAFWESLLLGTRGYRKNVMEVHQHIHSLSAIKKQHLDQWVKLFTETVDERYAGPRANLMKQRARSIATLMDLKLNHPSIGPSGDKN